MALEKLRSSMQADATLLSHFKWQEAHYAEDEPGVGADLESKGLGRSGPDPF